MYWDASALVPLFVVEPGSESVRTWLSEDDRIITWVWTRTEIVSGGLARGLYRGDSAAMFSNGSTPLPTVGMR